MVLFVERPTLRRLFTFALVGLSFFYLYQWREGIGSTDLRSAAWRSGSASSPF